MRTRGAIMKGSDSGVLAQSETDPVSSAREEVVAVGMCSSQEVSSVPNCEKQNDSHKNAQWRQNLKVGDLVDVFVDSRWCEGIVCTVPTPNHECNSSTESNEDEVERLAGAEESKSIEVSNTPPETKLDTPTEAPVATVVKNDDMATIDDDCKSTQLSKSKSFESKVETDDADEIAIKVRREVALVVRARRSGVTNEEAPVQGDISRPFTRVSDWRGQLRKGMKVEVFVPARNTKTAKSAGTWQRRRVEKIDFVKRELTVTAGANSQSGNVLHVKGRLPIKNTKKRRKQARQHGASTFGQYSALADHHGSNRKQKPVETLSLDSDGVREVFITISAGSKTAWSKDKPDSLKQPKEKTTRQFDSERGQRRLRHAKPAGLRNLGNTCFMNSVLQCLFSLQPLTHVLLDSRWVDSEVNTTNFLGTGGRLARSFSRLVQHVAEATLAERKGPLGMFKATLGTFAPTFAGTRQEDAMEFFDKLMDLLHEDLNRIRGKKPYFEKEEPTVDVPDTDVADLSWKHHLLRNDSAIVDVFQGQFKSHLTCPDCDGVSRTFDAFSTIPCPLPAPIAMRASKHRSKSKKRGKKGRKNRSHRQQYTEPEPKAVAEQRNRKLNLQGCLERFSAREQLSGMDTWFCPTCKDHVQAWKKMDLWRLPPVIVFQLKRFSSKEVRRGYSSRTTRQKLTESVDFPFDIDMNRHVLRDNDAEDSDDLLYELVGVVNHSGGLTGGHYTAYVRRKVNPERKRHRSAANGDDDEGDDNDDHRTALQAYQQDHRWFFCNDSSTSKASTNSIRSNMAYLLFYERTSDAKEFRRRMAERNGVVLPQRSESDKPVEAVPASGDATAGEGESKQDAA